MFKFLIPTILIGAAVTGFLLYTNPIYKDISALNLQVASYKESLANANLLEQKQDELIKKYNSINLQNLEKIKKLLPDNVDSVRLILEIGEIASRANFK